MADELNLRIILEAPPAGVDFGLQSGQGRLYETVQKQRSASKDLVFEFTVGVKAAGQTDTPDFTGPFVQGPRGERFVYIGIGTSVGQLDSHWSRRLKIPLSGITASMAASQQGLETRVPGTGRDGGPNCATVKPFPGWVPSKR